MAKRQSEGALEVEHPEVACGLMVADIPRLGAQVTAAEARSALGALLDRTDSAPLVTFALDAWSILIYVAVALASLG